MQGDKKPVICGSWNVRMHLTYRCVSSICSVTFSTIFNLLSHFDFFISHAPCTASSLSAILVSNFHLKQTDSISEGKASMDLFINDDHFPTEKKVIQMLRLTFLGNSLQVQCSRLSLITAAKLSVNSQSPVTPASAARSLASSKCCRNLCSPCPTQG